MDKDIERALEFPALIGDAKVKYGSDSLLVASYRTEAVSVCLKLARRLQASEARVAELEEAIGGVSIQLDTFTENSDDCIFPAKYISNVNFYLKQALTKDQ